MFAYCTVEKRFLGRPVYKSERKIEEPVILKKLVAGAGFEPATFGL